MVRCLHQINPSRNQSNGVDVRALCSITPGVEYRPPAESRRMSRDRIDGLVLLSETTGYYSSFYMLLIVT